MDLPKNYTQIGEINRYCKIYLEDYVVSYIKQLNGHARDKEMAVGLFGTRKEEDGITYLFLYGACQLNFLQKTTRHLSQAVLQEAERIRKKYFQEYEFLGCQLLNGERLEGIHVYEQGNCRYIEGYAHFYEKNASMLQFMLDERKEGMPEKINVEKYDEVRKRQEERRRTVTKSPKAAGKLPKMAVVAVMAVFIVAGLLAMEGSDKLDRLQTAAGQMIAEIGKKQLPDAMEVRSNHVQAGTVVAEEKLADALLSENDAQTVDTEADSAEENVENTEENTEENTVENTEGNIEEEIREEPVSYTVKKGDTLIGICLRMYGDSKMLQTVCEANQIANPDDIKEGNKIFLPQ